MDVVFFIDSEINNYNFRFVDCKIDCIRGFIFSVLIFFLICFCESVSIGFDRVKRIKFINL